MTSDGYILVGPVEHAELIALGIGQNVEGFIALKLRKFQVRRWSQSPYRRAALPPSMRRLVSSVIAG
jgi:hypothetical protein